MCSAELRAEFGCQVSDRNPGVQRGVTGLDWAAPSSAAPRLRPGAPSRYGAAGGGRQDDTSSQGHSKAVEVLGPWSLLLHV